MLKILGRPTSTNVMKVLWFCDEAGLSYEHDAEIGGAFGRNDQPDYLAMNPNGRVPTVIDDGFVMWESNSIIRYLARKSKSELYPSDLRARHLIERWMDWELSVIAPQQAIMLVGLIRTAPEKRDAARLETALTAWTAGMKILDAQLGKTAFAGGDAFTLADIPLLPIAHRWFKLPIQRPDLPNLKRWYDSFADRPAVQKWVMIELA
jgi:glutathione S-transferase